MNIRSAILMAADHIERNPGDFRWHSVVVPDCGSPGCAIGWIGHFLGHEHSATGFRTTSKQLWGNDDFLFYSRMSEVTEPAPYGSWYSSAPNCARALRLYADKYHPATPVLLPNWQAMAATQTVPADAVSEEVAQ